MQVYVDINGGLNYNPGYQNLGVFSMSEIIKTCKVHGPLTIDQVSVNPRKDRPNGKGEIRCLQCKSAIAARAYEKRKTIFIETATDEEKKGVRDEINAKVRADRLIDPEKYRNQENKKRQKNLERSRKLDILKKYNFTEKQYDDMLETQGHRCAICKEYETRKSRTPGEISRLAVDHCHKTGKVRAFLCHKCNQFIGFCNEDENILMEGIIYLRKHNTE